VLHEQDGVRVGEELANVRGKLEGSANRELPIGDHQGDSSTFILDAAYQIQREWAGVGAENVEALPVEGAT
jgi:hypothetical protein